MKKELTENDIKYPILSMLFDSSEELAARAGALQDSIVNDLADDSHPRLRQLEVISELLKSDLAKSGRVYQQALQQVNLIDLRQLIESSEEINSRTKLITTIEQVRKLANQLSFTIDLSLEHTDGSLSWTETTSLDSTVSLDTPSQQIEISPSTSVDEVISQLTARGYRVTNTAINQIRHSGGTLSINNNPVLEIKSDGIDSRFLGLFFHGPKKLKKKSFQLGDVIEMLKDKEDKPDISNRQLQKRYSDARIRINRAVEAKAGISEFICYKNKAFYINKDLTD